MTVARGFAVDTCADWGLEQACDLVALLVSETVTNAVVHADSDIDLRMSEEGGTVRVQVIDESPAPPHPQRAALSDEGGRGLALLDALASSWGSTPWGDGKAVWFDIR